MMVRSLKNFVRFMIAVQLLPALESGEETLVGGQAVLEGTPRGVKLEQVEAAMRLIDGVNDVHDLHVWNIGSESRALSCHISIADIPLSVSDRILRDVKDRLHHDFHIDHTTIQFEHVDCETAHGCVMPVGASAAHHHH